MQTKKLESRQDVLDLWVSKGATFYGTEVSKAQYLLEYIVKVEYTKYPQSPSETNIYEILYSPESNFFEVINSVCDKENKKFLNIMKVLCVTSPDPLQYLLENINESISS